MVVFIKTFQTEGDVKQINVSMNGEHKEVVYDDLSTANKSKFTKFYNEQKNHAMCSISGYPTVTEILILTPDAVDIENCPAEDYSTMNSEMKSDLDNFLEMVTAL
jgi:hypothetical protein